MLQRLQLFLLSLFTLFAIALLEKGLFAATYTELHQGLGPFELLQTLLWGFRFDLAISASLALPAFLAAQLIALIRRSEFRSTLRWTTFIAAVVLILLHGADTLYFGEAGRHLGYELKEGANSAAALAAAALTTYAQPVLLQLLLMVVSYFTTRWLFGRFTTPSSSASLGRRLGAEAMVVPLLLLSVLMVRGGLQNVPMEPLNAHRIGDTTRATLALNGAYNALYFSTASNALKPMFATAPREEQLGLLRQMYHTPPPGAQGEPQRKNIVFVLLESWSGAYMAPYGNTTVTTPNFDRLRQEGLTTRAMLAGGGRTTEGMFATFCSAQNPLGQTVAQTHLQNYDYDCLPEQLSKAGWSTAFFQGSNKETSGTGSFAQLLGFSDSYGKADINAASDTPLVTPNSWGYHDADIYRFTIEKMRQMPRPFLVGINTNTTHDQQLPEGVPPLLPMDDRANRFQSVLHFADSQLNDFITEVRNTPGLEETLFVLVADHTGLSPATPLQRNLIPFAILAPGVAPQSLDVVANQRDIAPTVLQLLNMEVPQHFTGRSLLAQGDAEHFSDYYRQGVLGWVEGNEALQFPLNEPQRLKCFDISRQLNDQTTHPCSEQDLAMQQRALAFTHLSQSLLFKGELLRFAQLR